MSLSIPAKVLHLSEFLIRNYYYDIKVRCLLTLVYHSNARNQKTEYIIVISLLKRLHFRN